MPGLATYSFLDVQAAIVGPGGSIALGSGAGNAEEGISIEPTEDLDGMVVGADGSPMHSLHADRSARWTVRLLKTSIINGKLQAMLNVQRASGALHGQNTLTVTEIATGDVYTGQQVAFAKQPSNTYAKDANIIEWNFNVGTMNVALGVGIPLV